MLYSRSSRASRMISSVWLQARSFSSDAFEIRRADPVDSTLTLPVDTAHERFTSRDPVELSDLEDGMG